MGRIVNVRFECFLGYDTQSIPSPRSSRRKPKPNSKVDQGNENKNGPQRRVGHADVGREGWKRGQILEENKTRPGLKSPGGR